MKNIETSSPRRSTRAFLAAAVLTAVAAVPAADGVGNVITVDDSAAADHWAAVASSGNLYLTVWYREIAPDQIEIWGRRYSNGGAPLGDAFQIYGDGVNAYPAVGFVEATNTFLVGWTSYHDVWGSRIMLRGMTEGGVLGNPFYADSAQGNDQNFVCIGGDFSGTDDEALVVWQEESNGIEARVITMQANGDATPAGLSFFVDEPPQNFESIHPAISKGVGDSGDHLIVWERYAPSTEHGAIYGRAYDRNGNALHTEAELISREPVGSHGSYWPSVDGNGESFLVAFERSEELFSTYYRDIAVKCVRIEESGEIYVPLATQFVEDKPLYGESKPDVVFTATGALVSYVDYELFDGNIAKIEMVDPWSGRSVAAEQVSAPASHSASSAKLTRFDPDLDSTHDKGLVVFTHAWVTDYDIFAVPYEAYGDISPIDAGCGTGGDYQLANPVAGNQDFEMRLFGSEPNALAVLVIGSVFEPIGCGPCTLIPNLEAVYYANTNANGDASVEIPLGLELAGLTFFSQWATFGGDGGCPLADLGFSRALITTIGSEL